MRTGAGQAFTARPVFNRWIMAGYSTLKAERQHFAPIADFLDTLKGKPPFANVATIEDLMYTEAKRLMLTDLQVARGYDPNDSIHAGYVDELSDTQTEFFQQALAYKQMALTFERLDNGKDSLNRDKWLYYLDMYKNAVRSFSSLTLTQVQSGTVARSIRVSL